MAESVNGWRLPLAGLLCLLGLSDCFGVDVFAGSRVGQVSSASEELWQQVTFGAMGTEVKIEAAGFHPEPLKAAIAAARKEFDRVEDLMTSWRDSPLTRMNAAADGTPQVVPQELAHLISRALEIARISGGAFDPTFASAGKLWDFKAEPPQLPSEDELTLALQNVGWSKVSVDLEASTISMPAGTRIGLGGIAKGYGVDRAMEVLLQHDIKSAIVNAGGDLKVLGTKQGKPWEIAIKHPRDSERAIAVLPISNVCLVSSGDYERFFIHEGKRYHHILDPRTGKPATGAMSASVTAPDAALADALATALCVLGPEQGLRLASQLARVEALVVGMDGQVQMTTGLSPSK